MSRSFPTVAIVGRQNVGKSTLFNRLIEEPRALVSPIAGTTRDRNIALLRWRGFQWRIIDTGGIEEAPQDEIASEVRRHAERAAHEADVVCFVVDGHAGLTREDRHIAQLLRKGTARIILVINKVDNPADRGQIPHEIATIGFKDAVPLSAKNGSGTGELLDVLAGMIPGTSTEVHDDIRILLLGKPNVGKSSLVNRLVGEDRVIVTPIAHTTRDTQDTVITRNGIRYRLIDTAGIRRQARTSRISHSRGDERLELMSVEQTLRSLERADVAAVVLDATEPITSQDRRIVQEVIESKVGVMLVANKWDVFPEKTGTSLFAFEKKIRAEFPFLSWAPFIAASAVTGQRVSDILGFCKKIHDARHRTLTTSELAEFMRIMRSRLQRGRTARSRVVTLVNIGQLRTGPPHFHITIGPRDHLSIYHERFLVNTLRERYALLGTPIGVTIEQQLRK